MADLYEPGTRQADPWECPICLRLGNSTNHEGHWIAVPLTPSETVLDLHRPGAQGTCVACTKTEPGGYGPVWVEPWPCPTVRALAEDPQR